MSFVKNTSFYVLGEESLYKIFLNLQFQKVLEIYKIIKMSLKCLENVLKIVEHIIQIFFEFLYIKECAK